MKIAIVIIVSFLLVHFANNLIGVSGFLRVLTSAAMYYGLYIVYHKYVKDLF